MQTSPPILSNSASAPPYMPSISIHAYQPSVGSPPPAIGQVTFEPTQVQVGLTLAIILVFFLAISVVISSGRKTERCATLLSVWAVIEIISGNNSLAAPIFACATGCAVACRFSGPYWLWRFSGKHFGFYIGGTVTLMVLLLAFVIDPTDVHRSQIITVATLGAAGLLSIAGVQEVMLPFVEDKLSHIALVLSGVFLFCLHLGSFTSDMIGVILIWTGSLRQGRAAVYWWVERQAVADKKYLS